MIKRFKDFLGKLKEKKTFDNPVVQVAILSAITTLVMEMFSKSNPFLGIWWFLCNPIWFLINAMIVAVTYAWAIVFKRRYSIYGYIAFFWLLLAVINCAVINSRVTPFTAQDIMVLDTVFPVLFFYITPLALVLIVAAVLVVFIFLVKLCMKLPHVSGEHKYWKRLIQAALIAGVCLMVVITSMRADVIPTRFVNIRDAYRDYGLAYCFSNTLFNTGVDKPDDYSKDKVDGIIEQIQPTGSAEKDPSAPSPSPAPVKPTGSTTKPDEAITDTYPNIIFVQLESFFNVNRLNGVTFTNNPIPNLTVLYDTCFTGLLNVPAISAGTANTEFEVLTGMNMADFGPGEYPYKTVLTDKTTESIAFNLKNYGYSTHGIHNNTAEFYGRNRVYSNLGIDTFTAIEYMTGYEKNQLGWAKDKIITKYIDKALKSTEGQDFVFAVSVQGHGAYPDEDVLKDPSLLQSMDGLEGNVGEYNFAYYIEQISEMDSFVGALTNYLRSIDENTVLVLYGDHLPGFEFTENDITTGTLYDTEYVIWANYKMNIKRTTKDLEANDLGSYVLGLLGMDEGYITKLHQNRDSYDEEEFLDSLKTFEYDMLYGDMNCWNGVNPYKANAIKYGYDPIKIDGIETIKDPSEDDYYYVTIKGENFNEYSTLFINGEDKEDTIYVDENTLFIPGVELVSGDKLVISQSSVSPTVLSASNEFFCNEINLGL